MAEETIIAVVKDQIANMDFAPNSVIIVDDGMLMPVHAPNNFKPPRVIMKTDGAGNEFAVTNPNRPKRWIPTNITPKKKKRR